jgi:hypothetical protein
MARLRIDRSNRTDSPPVDKYVTVHSRLLLRAENDRPSEGHARAVDDTNNPSRTSRSPISRTGQTCQDALVSPPMCVQAFVGRSVLWFAEAPGEGALPDALRVAGAGEAQGAVQVR